MFDRPLVYMACVCCPFNSAGLGSRRRARPSCHELIVQDTLFRDFRIESNNNNEIWIELHLDPLLKILRSAEACGACLPSSTLPLDDNVTVSPHRSYP